MLDLWGNEVIETEQIKKKPLSFFDCIKHITNDRSYSFDELLPFYDSFMVNRALSEDETNLKVVDILNKIDCIPNRAKFKFLKSMIQTHNQKWTKKKKDKLYDKVVQLKDHNTTNQLIYVNGVDGLESKLNNLIKG